MSKNDYINEEDADNNNSSTNESFYDSLDRIASSSASCSCSNSEDENDVVSDEFFPPSKFNYDVWISEPASVSERRNRLLSDMGLAGDPALLRSREDAEVGRARFGLSVSESDHSSEQGQGGGIFRSRSDGDAAGSNSEAAVVVSCSDRGRFDSEISVCCDSIVSIDCSGSFVDSDGKSKVKSSDLVKSFSGKGNGENGSLSYNNSGLVNKPPTGKNYRRVDGVGCDLVELSIDRTGSLVDRDGMDGDDVSVEEVCKIKNLDNGKEFVVNEIREDGMWNKVKEVGTGKQLTMEEFEMTVGHSPIVQELMRRQNVEDGIRDDNDLDENVGGGGGPKPKKKGGWFKSIRSVASLMTGHKERRSSDERDSSSEKGGRRSSSATDDSQDVSFHGPERIKVRQYGKSCKELTAMYKSQEIQAHKGSIWTIKFSLDGRYLASAGEDCVIHIWRVVESERKGDMLMDKPEEVNLNTMLLANESPDRSSLSPNVDNHTEKKRRGRTSISRKSVSLDHIVIPETIFAITEKPICSFNGHLDDVLDLSWSKSQHLLSSSMDKTVRLWHLSSKSCLKVFSHSDYVTCIQFNPADDRYFISGSLDAKVRIWSIPDRQVVDWIDVHEMVTAACYTPDGQGALVGSHKGSCRVYSTAENKLQQKSQINLQNKKKSIQKKITGFQFVAGSMSELLITSADSRIRVVDGVDLVHKFKGFRNTNSQISACLTANVKYVVAASEDSHVYVWKNEADSRPSRSKGVTVTCSYEYFHCQDVSVALPWPGMDDAWGVQDNFAGQHGLDSNLDEVSTINHPPTPVESGGNDGLLFASGCGGSPLHGTISSATNNYFFDRIAATWPEEKLRLAPRNQSPRLSMDFSNGSSDNMSAWGTVILTAGLRGEIRTFQNFGLPVRI